MAKKTPVPEPKAKAKPKRSSKVKVTETPDQSSPEAAAERISSMLAALRAEPWRVLDLLAEWGTEAAVCMRQIDGRSPFWASNGANKVTINNATGFWPLARDIGIWCDVEVKSVSPTPILLFTRQIYARAGDGRDEYICPVSVLGKLYNRALITMNRLIPIALVRYAEWRNGIIKPGVCDLVTSEQVAEIVYLEPRSLEKYRADWPEPRIKGKGQRKAQWIYQHLLPKLREQFPDEQIPDSPPLK